MTKDPVCAMEIDEQTASWSSVHKEKSYYFCSAGCKDKFDKEPDKFLPQKK
ncbi:MAG: YHS domain-containing protein [Nitrospira sp.]|nr:YHS domain-containing protein [Nitrospira sp.]HBP87458.1 YHS domain-containing protein [Nitrospiraceae bacterium]